MGENDRYERAEKERDEFVQKVLTSQSSKKVVVAGPGTGKTHLFKEILKTKNAALTLTFINALVDDLSLGLKGLSDVRTLHSFALGAFRNAVGDKGKKVKIFSKLSNVIKEDASILLGKDMDFDVMFQNRDDGNVALKFYKKRKDYYGDHYGHTDIVYAIVKIFEAGEKTIPSFEQIVVDEFQDFNLLEVSLIDLLAKKSPVVLAGDDDQALYFFKSADPVHIRKRYDTGNTDYESFTLPYCSRSSRVIVEATNDILSAAGKLKNLKSIKNRIPKPYIYFEDKQKDKEQINEKNPTIVHCQIYDTGIPWFIAKAIEEIAEEQKKEFSVLIISPTRDKAVALSTALRDKGFAGIMCDPKGEKDYTAIEGLRILSQDDKDNLGWRIMAKFILKPKDFKKFIEKSASRKPETTEALLRAAGASVVVDQVKDLLSQMTSEKPIDSASASLLTMLGMDPEKLVKDAVKQDLFPERLRLSWAAKLQMTATTIPGSKGLAADYVFITHFDDMFFKIRDQDICNLLVALTRARKRAYLVSTRNNGPAVGNFFKPERIEPRARMKKRE